MGRTYSKLTNGIELTSIDRHFKFQLPPDPGRGSQTFGNSPIDFRPVIIVALDSTAAVAHVDVPIASITLSRESAR